jgi:hypothetical protein
MLPRPPPFLLRALPQDLMLHLLPPLPLVFPLTVPTLALLPAHLLPTHHPRPLLVTLSLTPLLVLLPTLLLLLVLPALLEQVSEVKVVFRAESMVELLPRVLSQLAQLAPPVLAVTLA